MLSEPVRRPCCGEYTAWCLHGHKSPLRNSQEKGAVWDIAMENRVDGNECISQEYGSFLGELMGPRSALVWVELRFQIPYPPGGCSSGSETAVCSGPIHTHSGERLKESGGTGP